MIQLTTGKVAVAGVVGLLGAATYAVIFYPMTRVEEYSKPCLPNLSLGTNYSNFWTCQVKCQFRGF